MPEERSAKQILLAAPTEKWPRGRPRTRWRGSWFRLGVEPAELLEIAVDREVFRVLGLQPAILLRGKTGMKMNECMNFSLKQFKT